MTRSRTVYMPVLVMHSSTHACSETINLSGRFGGWPSRPMLQLNAPTLPGGGFVFRGSGASYAASLCASSSCTANVPCFGWTCPGATCWQTVTTTLTLPQALLSAIPASARCCAGQAKTIRAGPWCIRRTPVIASLARLSARFCWTRRRSTANSR